MALECLISVGILSIKVILSNNTIFAKRLIFKLFFNFEDRPTIIIVYNDTHKNLLKPLIRIFFKNFINNIFINLIIHLDHVHML